MALIFLSIYLFHFFSIFVMVFHYLYNRYLNLQLNYFLKLQTQILTCVKMIFDLFWSLTETHHEQIFHLNILSTKKGTTCYLEFYQNFYRLVILVICTEWHYLLSEYKYYQISLDHNPGLKILHSSLYTNILLVDSMMLPLPKLLNQTFY